MIALMKSYNGLYERMIAPEEIKASIREAAKKRTKYKKVQKYLANIDAHAEEIRQQIESGSWNPPHHKEYILREGAHKKERNIQKPRWDNEQIIHHMLMRQLKPIVLPRVNRFCCGSIEGRSSHFLLKSMKRWIKHYHGKRVYIAELDIRKFYDSVDVEILKKMLKKKIRDKRYLNLLFKVIDGAAPGLPKGFYTSPFLAHLYFGGMDNYILQDLKPDHYARFVDNIWLFSTSKRKLHRMVEALSGYIHMNLRIRLKSDWQIFRFDDTVSGRTINLLGFKVHRERIGLRKGILKRLRGKVNRMKRLHRCTWRDASSIISRMGFIKYSDTYGWYKRYVKSKLSIRYCKQRVRKHQKEVNEHDRLENRAGQQSRKAA